ncbi:MAG: alpha-E domain-containing protein [Pseudomonadales bacterium]|nr:alpha-E domain-containing protein [Pseudomonadales bacterium]
MLARVGERMYWFGRYVERAENMARLISVNTNLVLDLPKVKHIWGSMIDITGSPSEFNQRYQRVDERNVIKFLLEDDNASLSAAVRRARENARTTREIIPAEAFERVNELHLYVKKNVDKALRREGRHRFLADVMNLCHQLTGLLAGNMSGDTAYNFIKIGRNLERADMTTRILDVGCLHLMQPDTVVAEYENILWMNVLRSLTAYQMYRQHVHDRVNGEDVVDFLLRDMKFPRAVGHCLGEVYECCAQLPRQDATVRAISHAQRVIAGCDVAALLNSAKLHEFIDDVQLDLAEIHRSVRDTWFGAQVVVEQEQTQA